MNGSLFGKKLWIFVCLVLFIAGCGDGGSRGEARAPAGHAYSDGPAPASDSGGREEASAAAPASPSQQAGGFFDSSPRKSAPDPRPESRPGLGTEFGEARTSRVHDVTFARASSRPFAVAALNYNDRRGVEALASVEARRSSGRSVATGGGAVTISIRDTNGDPLEAVHVGDRTFVVGQSGQRYSIVLENHYV